MMKKAFFLTLFAAGIVSFHHSWCGQFPPVAGAQENPQAVKLRLEDALRSAMTRNNNTEIRCCLENYTTIIKDIDLLDFDLLEEATQAITNAQSQQNNQK